jgi:S1-C subfamily serine protease
MMPMMAALQEAYIQAVEKSAASTVNIGSAVGPWGPQGRRWPRRGVGSGVVYDASGHILTNSHVIGEAERILVTMADGRSLEGRLVGDDEETDVAVIKVEATDLKPAEFADSEKLRAGQPVLAIGNPLGLAGGPTVTSGVVSSLRRSLRRDWLPYGDGLKVIQTDAAVNPGNSGGPLVDLEGRVVAITAATMPWAEGIGFAIPINDARRIADELIAHGRIPRPWIGVAGYDMNRRIANQYGLTATRGVLVTEVKPESPAAEANLHVGDVLTSLGSKPLEDLGDLIESLREAKIGDTVVVEVERQGRKIHAQVRLGTRPF